MIASAPAGCSSRYDRCNRQNRFQKNRFSGNCLFSFKRVMMEGWLASSNQGWTGADFWGGQCVSSIKLSIRTDSAPSEGKKAPEDEADKSTILALWLAFACGIDFVDCPSA
jgi:hypothetical protein